jgi:hypothetical protein
MRPTHRSPLLPIMLAAVAGGLLVSPSVGGACEKDTDCKPPSVCQSRKCVAGGATSTQTSTAPKKHHRKHRASTQPAPKQ